MAPRITTYPLFRLTVALAAGIFLSDRFLSESVVGLYALAVLCGVLCIGLYFFHRYSFRFLFGACACLAMGLVGAIAFWLHHREVAFDWPSDEALYVGRVESVPAQRGSGYVVNVHVECLKTGSDSCPTWRRVDRNVRLMCLADSAFAPLKYADRLCFYGRVSRPSSDSSLSGFDYGRYLECQNIGGTAVAFAGRWKPLGPDGGFSLRGLALECRERILNVYRSWGLDRDVYAVVSALTVGDKGALSRELRNVYTVAGTSHVLALSGLHVGILALVLSWALFPLRLVRGGRWLASFCVVFVLWAFAFLTGLSPSVVRAVTMFSLYVVASVVSEDRFSGGYAVVLAAFIMLLFRPLYLFDLGFQLSFSAVISILLLHPLFQRWWTPKRRAVRFVWNVLTLSLAAQIGTAPIVLYCFGTFPAYFLLANLFVTPFAVLILTLSLLALCLLPVPVLNVGVVKALALSALGMTRMMEWVYGLPGSQITSVYLSGFQAALLVAVLVFAYAYSLKRTFRRALLTLLALNVFAASLVADLLSVPKPSVCLARGGVYTCCGRNVSRLEPVREPCRIGGSAVVLLNDGRWKNKRSAVRLSVDYAYVCRGFRGSAADIHRLFRARLVMLDAWLPDWQREKLKSECHDLGMEYRELPDAGFRFSAL